MMYRALISFCGPITMRKGQVAPLDKAAAADLLERNYIEEVPESTETDVQNTETDIIPAVMEETKEPVAEIVSEEKPKAGGKSKKK